jgi:hypothetical protein
MSLNLDPNDTVRSIDLHTTAVPDDVATAVKASLKEGRVPPIFHAYCALLIVDYDSRKEGATEDEDA